jgi:hypothetical protein
MMLKNNWSEKACAMAHQMIETKKVRSEEARRAKMPYEPTEDEKGLSLGEMMQELRQEDFGYLRDTAYVSKRAEWLKNRAEVWAWEILRLQLSQIRLYNERPDLEPKPNMTTLIEAFERVEWIRRTLK